MRFGILGPITAWDGDRPLRVGGPREQKLLATLLLNPGRSIPWARLVEAIWDEDAPATARAQVHNSVAALRRNLVGDGGEQVPIARAGAGFLIGVGDDALDATAFARQVEAAARLAASGQAADAVELLRAALDLWRGPALGGLDSGVLGAEARRLDEQRLAALEQRIALEIELGRDAVVVGELAALSRAHPLRERLIELHMLALYRGGRRQDALEVYQEARRRLAEESGLDPRAELDALHQAILRGDVGLDRPLTTPVAEPAPPRAVPAQLPADIAGFTGREAELAMLDRLWGERAKDVRPHSIAAIVGPAGVGKSALAVRWAHHRRAEFPDGQLHLDLHGFDAERSLSPLEALGRLLRALGRPDAELAAEVDERAAQYRSVLAGRRVVVILDNAASSEQIRPLLPGTGPQATLITSRRRLDGLSVHEGVPLLELAPLSDAEAIRLVRNAALAKAGDGDANALADLVRLCDRLPLALRIAAARLGGQSGRSLTALVEELGDEHRRLSALALPSGDAAVRTAFAASFADLPPEAQTLLSAMGLHPGPEPGAAACAALAGTTPAEAAGPLAELTARHIVLQPAPGRYRMHDLIRLYARERASPGLARDGVRRMLEWYLCAADAADQTIRPWRAIPFQVRACEVDFAGEIEALDWFDAEAANLTAAIAHAEHTDPDLCWKLAAVLFAWLERRQRRTEWLAVYTIGLRAAEALGELGGEALMRQSLGVCLHYMDRKEEAIAYFEQVVAVRRRIGEKRPLAIALANLGNQFAETGRPDRGVALLTEALELLESLPDSQAVVGITLNNLGWAHHKAGRDGAAADCYRRAAAIARENDNPQAVSFAEGNLALVYERQGDHRNALRHWQRAARAGRLAGDRRLEANSFAGMGKARIKLGLTALARADLRQALAMYLEIHDSDADEMRELLNGLQ